MTDSLPSNVHISSHPCAQAKLSQLRSASSNAREVRALIHEIALIVGCEALSHCLTATSAGTDHSPLGYAYTTTRTSPPSIALIPILRSGLSMLDALTALLPHPVPVHHLGLFRDKATLQPVEYYNNLREDAGPADLAIVVDPVIATGATACAAVESLRDWGVRKVVVCAVIGTRDGLRKVAEVAGEDEVSVFVAGCDEATDAKGMIRPGLGDVGDRLFLTMGK